MFHVKYNTGKFYSTTLQMWIVEEMFLVVSNVEGERKDEGKYHLYNSINHNLEFEVPYWYVHYTKYPEKL